MAPLGWATPEEREFLRSLLPEYEACQVKRKYKAFWQQLNMDYFSRFPLLEKTFPGRKLSDLTQEEKEVYSGEISKQQQRLKEWFRWQMNPRSRNSGRAITKKDLHQIYKGRTRGKKPYEVFAKLYAPKVETEKSARCEAQGIKGRQQLAVWHEVAKELYQSANGVEMAAVNKEMDAAREAKGDVVMPLRDSSDSPVTFLRYLNKLPALLDVAVTPAVRKAGVLALVTIVGPDPEQGGRLTARTLQFGGQPNTPVFSEVWEDHDCVYLEEVTRFAGRYEFPPAVCAARALDAKPAPPDPSFNPLPHTSDILHPGSCNATPSSTRSGDGVAMPEKVTSSRPSRTLAEPGAWISASVAQCDSPGSPTSQQVSIKPSDTCMVHWMPNDDANREASLNLRLGPETNFVWDTSPGHPRALTGGSTAPLSAPNYPHGPLALIPSTPHLESGLLPTSYAHKEPTLGKPASFAVPAHWHAYGGRHFDEPGVGPSPSLVPRAPLDGCFQAPEVQACFNKVGTYRFPNTAQ